MNPGLPPQDASQTGADLALSHEPFLTSSSLGFALQPDVPSASPGAQLSDVTVVGDAQLLGSGNPARCTPNSFIYAKSSVNSQILYDSSEDYRSLPNASVMRFEELPFEKKLTTLELAQLNVSFF